MKPLILTFLATFAAFATFSEDIPINTTTCDITYSTSHSQYPGTKAFDGVTGAGGRWLAEYKKETPWVVVHFKSGASYVPTGYTVTGWNGDKYTQRRLKRFILKGSVDGENWDELDDQTRTEWEANVGYDYSISCSTAYSWFRFEMPEVSDQSADYTCLCELVLHYDATALTPAIIAAPLTGTTSVSRFPKLIWLCQAANATFDVYFGTSPTLGSSDLLETTTATSILSPAPLDYATTYYWRVDASQGGQTLTGDVVSFTTISRPSGIIAYDGFESYAVVGDGTTLAGLGEAANGWTSAWQEPSKNVTAVVIDASLDYQGGKVSIDGGTKAVSISGLSADNGNGAMRRTIDPQDDSPLYLSFLVQPASSGRQLFDLLLQDASVGGASQGVGADVGFPSGKISAVCNAGSTVRVDTPQTLVGGETYFVVCRFTRGRAYSGDRFTFLRTEVLVNPTAVDEPDTGWTTATTSKNATQSIGRLFLRTAENAGTFLLDEIRFGHDWESVVPPAPPASTVIILR